MVSSCVWSGFFSTPSWLNKWPKYFTFLFLKNTLWWFQYRLDLLKTASDRSKWSSKVSEDTWSTRHSLRLTSPMHILIYCWKVAGPLLNPKAMQLLSKNPLFPTVKTVRCLSSYSVSICQYPLRSTTLRKYMDPVNPYMTNGLFHPYQLDESISKFRGVYFYFIFDRISCKQTV